MAKKEDFDEAIRKGLPCGLHRCANLDGFDRDIGITLVKCTQAPPVPGLEEPLLTLKQARACKGDLEMASDTRRQIPPPDSYESVWCLLFIGQMVG